MRSSPPCSHRACPCSIIMRDGPAFMAMAYRGLLPAAGIASVRPMTDTRVHLLRCPFQSGRRTGASTCPVRPCGGLSSTVTVTRAATRSGEEMPMAGPAEFKGKVALITGGSGGIGLRVAEQLAGAGAHVFINGRSAERGERAAAKLLQISQDVRFIAGDCASYGD